MAQIHEEAGATAAEYAILAAFIAVAIVVAVTAFGVAVDGLFQSAVDAWP